MSRSKRKTPVRGICGSRHHISEKTEKRKANRKMRRKNKVLLETSSNLDQLLFKHKDEVEDVYGWSKDGKIRFDPKDPRWKKELRK